MSKEEMNERYMATAKRDGTLDVNWYVENNRLYRRVWQWEGEWSLPIEYTNREMAHVMTGIENRLVDIVAKKCYAPSTDQVERERNNKCARCGEECRESSISSTDLLRDVRHCIGLLNSMILSGETHSDTSRRRVVEAIQTIENMEAGDHDNY